MQCKINDHGIKIKKWKTKKDTFLFINSLKLQ